MKNRQMNGMSLLQDVMEKDTYIDKQNKDNEL